MCEQTNGQSNRFGGGQSKRMLSIRLVLHTVGGKTILVIDKALLVSDAPPIIVYGRPEDVKNKTVFGSLKWVYQDKPLGTPCCSQALPYIKDSDTVLIMYADIPLISTQTLKNMIRIHGKSKS